MLQGVPHKVLSAGQNKCPAQEDIKFPVDGDRIHPRSLGEATGIHLAYPHHSMDECESFYNGLTMTSRANIDAAAGGAFLDMTITIAKELIEKMVSN